MFVNKGQESYERLIGMSNIVFQILSIEIILTADYYFWIKLILTMVYGSVPVTQNNKYIYNKNIAGLGWDGSKFNFYRV